MPATLSGSRMRHNILFFIAACNVLLTGCYKNHLYVQQEWVDRSFLASSHLNTPDPRQKEPPFFEGGGQRLLIGWDFPKSLFEQQLTLEVTVRFWDQSEQLFLLPLTYKRGAEALPFFKKGGPKILTYRVRVLNKEKEVLETWEHQFWTEKIEVRN